MTGVRLWLLRHAKVTSHRGDQPLAPDAFEPVDAAARAISAVTEPGATLSFHSTRTKRAQQTANALRDCIAPGAPDARSAWGLRNPDLYLFGDRVEMVSTPEAFAAQVTQVDAAPEDVLAQSFYRSFLNTSDRVGYWLNHADPPGESALDVARRVAQFAKSLRPMGGDWHHAVCVSHSPVLRAVLTRWFGLDDPGEPEWVEAIELIIEAGASEARFRSERISCDVAIGR
ncbi:histidine phosphatase family protein [Chelativorans sp. M5D2P16]|uniref:phosphoglycerate mutase family protein n=1 Tax=Chelativorans sp. M5D2P16 TaxID=3095678 RepID=UPI002ACA5498|nr:histidine phosphatase family protein [Chelativorans sp. M5D2P16]MDZ5697452.1 histidine phosphatase family protein [Chelativorans sp. M5D2P16]